MESREITVHRGGWSSVELPTVSSTVCLLRQSMTWMRARLLVLGLLIAYLLPGVVGHDPWKQDEAYTFGLVLHILESGDWIVPTLAGQPFMEKPPLFYISAAMLASFLSPWLALHDGARLAATVWIVFGLLMSALAARRLHGTGAAVRTILYLIGSIGLLQHAHEMITDTSLFAGFALAIYGMTWAHSSSWRAGSCIGMGVGMGFLSKGLVEPAMIGLACCLLPVFAPALRTRTYRRTLTTSMLFALPWLVIWPAALFVTDRNAFDTWLWTNNLGRFTGTASLGADAEQWYYVRVLPWFTFPAGFAAVAAIAGAIKWRRGLDAELIVPCAVAIAIVAVLTSASTMRSLYALPLLIPLAIVAARRPLPERRWIEVASSIFATLFALLALALWAIWGYAVAQGHPPAIDALARWLPADFEPGVRPVHLVVAATVGVIWLFCWRALSGTDRHLYRWVAGVTMVWGTAMTLHLPWLDHAKSFREPFVAVGSMIASDECVLESGLGEPQRGMLHYIAGIVASDSNGDDGECRYLLVQTNHREHLLDVPRPGWQKIWAGRRPGEHDESFTLYERNDDDLWQPALYAGGWAPGFSLFQE